MFSNTPKIEIHKTSERNTDGPFFAWNWLKLGKHSGTHFERAHTDTMGMQRCIAWKSD